MATLNNISGRKARFTRLDENGRPIYGSESQAVTSGIIQVTWTPNASEGEGAEGLTNMAGEQCVPGSTPCPSIENTTVEIQFCDVDPCIVLMMYPSWVPYYDDFGVVKGFTMVGGMRCDVGFALEVWGSRSERRTGPRCGPGAGGGFTYWLAPRLVGAVPGAITVSNSATTFTFSGTTTTPVNWGRGPYLVDNVGGLPSVLRDEVPSDGQVTYFDTTVRPPADTDGCVGLPRPIPQPADLIVSCDRTQGDACLCVQAIVDNHGFGPAVIDWGDGSAPEATPDCSTARHCYTAGTYEICVTDQQTPIVQTCRSVTIPIVTDAPTLDVVADDDDPMCVVATVDMPEHSDGRVTVMWGDGSEAEEVTVEPGTPAQLRHCYQLAGVYQIRAERTELPTYSTTEDILVPAQENPEASATVSGMTVTLTVDNHGNGGTVVDWGDGSSTQGPSQDGGTVDHVYAEPGTYEITVTSVSNQLARTQLTVQVGDEAFTVTAGADASDPSGMTAQIEWEPTQ